MKNILANLYEFLTMDNSHEEDDEPFEYYDEPAGDSVFMSVASVALMIVLAVLCFVR